MGRRERVDWIRVVSKARGGFTMTLSSIPSPCGDSLLTSLPLVIYVKYGRGENPVKGYFLLKRWGLRSLPKACTKNRTSGFPLLLVRTYRAWGCRSDRSYDGTNILDVEVDELLTTSLFPDYR